jgi:hypothetical protein
VVDGVAVFNVSVEAKNHKEFCDCVIGRMRD